MMKSGDDYNVKSLEESPYLRQAILIKYPWKKQFILQRTVGGRMKKKLVNVLSVFVIFILLSCIFNENEDIDNDISNLPPSSQPTFVKLTQENSKQLSSSLSSDDYSKLMNIDFTFRILPLVCQNSVPFLMIVIHSAPRNIENRKIIRLTWASNSNRTKLLFMLGSLDVDDAKNSELQNKISEESHNFHDIIQGSFLDSYVNLTYKHVMAYKYIIYHCNQTKFVLKTDDDVFVNIKYLLNYINSSLSDYGVEKLLMCNIWDHANVKRSFRSKYRLTYEQYRPTTFPAYCSGWFILYSPDVVLKLYQRAQKSKYFWIDDVFLTGILAQNLEISHFNIRNYVIPRRSMEKILNGNCDRISTEFIMGRPNMETKSISKLWSCMQKWLQ